MQHPTRRAWLAALPAALTGTWLAGCAASGEPGGASPLAIAPVTELGPLAPPPRLAVVLGSGGPRGYAHIGVMKVLEEAGLQPDLIVGASVGALLGAFWAAGWSANAIDELSKQGGPLTLFDPSPFADRGWIKGERLESFVNTRLGVGDIAQLPRRLIVGATRRVDKTPVFFAGGDVGRAVRASSAMPGIVSPVAVAGQEYEDGDVSLPVPASIARRLGAHFVIAVDVSARAGRTPPDAPAWMHTRDRLRRLRIEPEVAHADFLFHPDLPYRAGPWRSYFSASRLEGERHARERLPELLSRWRASGLTPTSEPRPA